MRKSRHRVDGQLRRCRQWRTALSAASGPQGVLVRAQAQVVLELCRRLERRLAGHADDERHPLPGAEPRPGGGLPPFRYRGGEASWIPRRGVRVDVG